ncbi:ADP-ribose glycohydrolase MACROD2 [Cebus imitator]|nr:ADP-ribose glycohydrolase MACROD2 [Cebus imitator]
MNEFFSVDDNEEEEDVEMKEDSEGLEPKGLSPPHKKSKAKKPECLKDSSEDENGPEEKQSMEEMEGQSGETDGVNTVTVLGPASEEAVEGCKDEDSAKDDNTTKGGEVTDHSVCNQDRPDGQENDSTKNEIKIETESQNSYMETEELSSQEDAVIVDQPQVIPLTDDQEETEGEKALGKDTPRLPGKSEEGSSDLENTPGPDVEMNTQVDNVEDPTESQQEDQLIGAQDETKEQRNGTK